MSLAFRRRYLLRQAEFRYAVLRIGHAAQKCKNPTETNPAGFSILATSYSRTAYRRTTIGAAAFHFRVRNGNGWCHYANVTREEERLRCSALVAAFRAARRWVGAVHRTALAIGGQSPLPEILKELSAFSLGTDSLTSTYRKKNVIRNSLRRYIGSSIHDSRFNDSRTLRLRFVLRSFVSSVCRSAKARNGLTEK